MRQFKTVVMRRPWIINRDAGPNVVGIVICKVDDDWCKDWDEDGNDAQYLEACIRNAVTDWALHRQEGRDAVRRSAFDFNLGDLAAELLDGHMVSDAAADSSRLDFYLDRQGIRSLEIQTVEEDNEHAWEFDDILFDEMKIDQNRLDQLDETGPYRASARM